MYSYRYDPDKDVLLKKEWGIGFEAIIAMIEGNRVIKVITHHNQQKYARQKMMIFDIDGYAYVVPYVKNPRKKEIFLKTIFPSRRMTKLYIKNTGAEQ